MLRRPRITARTGQRDRRGIEIVELAFALPVMTVLVFGAQELCEVLFLKQSLAVVSYEVGRLAARPGTDLNEAQTRFDSLMEDRRVTGGTITVDPADLSAVAVGEEIRIEISAPVAENSAMQFVLSGVPDVVESVVFLRE